MKSGPLTIPQNKYMDVVFKGKELLKKGAFVMITETAEGGRSCIIGTVESVGRPKDNYFILTFKEAISSYNKTLGPLRCKMYTQAFTYLVKKYVITVPTKKDVKALVDAARKHVGRSLSEYTARKTDWSRNSKHATRKSTGNSGHWLRSGSSNGHLRNNHEERICKTGNVGDFSRSVVSSPCRFQRE